MSDDFTTTTLHGRTCHLYQQNTAHTFPRLPVFYWGISRGNKDAVMTVVSYLKTHQPKAGFLLAAYESESWNDDFSPWAAQAVFGTESCHAM